MSAPSPGTGSCCAVGRTFVIVALSVTTVVSATGWVLTATRERPGAASPQPAPQTETVFVPVPVPVVVTPELSETVDVLVASRDLPVGTMLTRDELKSSVKIKKAPKDGLPPAYVINPEDLVDKRLTRPVRVEETFNPQDLSKGGGLTLPEGYDMVSLQVGPAQAAAGFVGPGTRVNVLATVRTGNKILAFPLLVNVLVVAVDTSLVVKEGSRFDMPRVVFAVTEKQALLLSLAKSRGCTLELLLRNPTKAGDADRNYDIDEVIKLLTDERQWGAAPTPAKPEGR